jgi:pantothenate kinase
MESQGRVRKYSLINDKGKFSFINPDPFSIGIDIGGTLIKLSVLIKIDDYENNLVYNEFKEIFIPDVKIKVFSDNGYHEIEDGILLLKKILTVNVETDLYPILKCLDNIKKIQVLNISGGGSNKFNEFLCNKLNLKINKNDELQALLYGNVIMNDYNTMYHLENPKLDEILQSAKSFKDLYTVNYNKINSKTDFVFPHIVVNIGSGVSIVKVVNDTTVERIGGTMCGGGTLIGLAKILIGVDDFNEILALAKKGDHRNLDLLVSDIYGSKITDNSGEVLKNLDLDILASSFGKVHQILLKDPNYQFKKEDIAQSLLILICFQISQLGYLFAKQLNINHIFYYGNFTQKDSLSIELLNFGTKFWGKEMHCHFNDLDGYLGSIGNMCTKFS